MALNLKKTKYMIFTRNRSFVEQERKIANVVIKRKISVRFLRVIIDEKFSWSTHIVTIKTKMARYLGIMYKIGNHLQALNYCCKITHRSRLQ